METIIPLPIITGASPIIIKAAIIPAAVMKPGDIIIKGALTGIDTIITAGITTAGGINIKMAPSRDSRTIVIIRIGILIITNIPSNNIPSSSITGVTESVPSALQSGAAFLPKRLSGKACSLCDQQERWRCFTLFQLCSLHQTSDFPTSSCAIALVFRPRA